MIIGSCFCNDVDYRTKRAQHDVYYNSLSIIVDGCIRHVQAAAALLEVGWPPEWLSDPTYDHRTLQAAHDILAAAWRFIADTAQPRLPAPIGHPDLARPLMEQWHDWLRTEVAAWVGRPHLVRLLMTILAHQNIRRGYDAEKALTQMLRERFSSVPWHVWQQL